MKVYVVTSNYGYDCNDFEGVFSTKEKAEEYASRLNKANGGGNCFSWDEYELDNP
ncbi:hypothetical protein ABE073_04125 [Lederbergia citrisecunda]|uniref:DUF7336 domain-containing protein n=1 Tax=Lederbergia citrisecunda TaxID=2833583 RepID=UPI003D2D1D81